MANDKKAIYGTGAGEWFWKEGEKRDLPHLHTFETQVIKVNALDMPKEPKVDPGTIIGHIQLYHYVIGVSEETLCQSSYTPKKALFPLGVGPLTYNLFHSLYLIALDAKEEEENYWVKLNKEALAYIWNEFKDDSKHKSCCIGELTLLFVCIFGRMLVTIGLKNTKNVQITWYAI
jgi:hypothetical protein